MIKLRILQWRYYAGLSSWAQCNHEGLCKSEERGKGQRNYNEMTKAEGYKAK